MDDVPGRGAPGRWTGKVPVVQPRVWPTVLCAVNVTPPSFDDIAIMQDLVHLCGRVVGD